MENWNHGRLNAADDLCSRGSSVDVLVKSDWLEGEKSSWEGNCELFLLEDNKG